jgi:hypothetical protein
MLERWEAKLERWMAKLERWVPKLVGGDGMLC